MEVMSKITMRSIAESHGFIMTVRGGCSGDKYKHGTQAGVSLSIIECKNYFKLYINNQLTTGRMNTLEDTLVGNGL